MTTFYVDYENGNITNSGLRHDGTVDSSSDTTHFIDSDLIDVGIDEGCFVWDTTRVLGDYVDSYDGMTGEITLKNGIAGLQAGDVFYLIAPFSSLKEMSDEFDSIGFEVGDIIYLRANQTETNSDENDLTLIFLPFVTLQSCDDNFDPWHDGSNTNYKIIKTTWRIDIRCIDNDMGGVTIRRVDFEGDMEFSFGGIL